MTRASIQEYAEAVRWHYLQASKEGKGKILHDATLKERYEPGTLFTEFRRDMVYRLRYRWEVNVYALEGDMSDETESSNDR